MAQIMTLAAAPPSAIPDLYAGLRSYQSASVHRALEPRRNLLYRPRLGKTRPAVRIIRRWIDELGYTKHLIVGPLFPLADVWTNELRANGFLPPSEGGGPSGYLVPLLVHDNKTDWVRAVLFDLIRGVARGRPVVILLNDDVLYRETTGPRGGRKRVVDIILDWAPDTLTRDESHRDGNAGSRRAHNLALIGGRAKMVRCLTGTPDGNGKIKLFSAFKVLDPTIFGTNKTQFLNRYCVVADRRVVDYVNQEEMLAKVSAVSDIVRDGDFFDIPRIEAIERRFMLPPYARELYRKLVEDNVLEIAALKVDIDARHHFARLARLSQLANGYLPVQDPEIDPAVTWVHDTKIESVVADLAEPLACGDKVVVSYLWRPEGDRITAALRKAYGPRTVVELNGRTPMRDRLDLIAPFSLNAPEMESDARVIVIQEATGNLGISLARADHLHFLSWSVDYNAVDQMKNRTRDPVKQRRLTETFHGASGTVDIYKRGLVRKREAETLMRVSFRDAAEGNLEDPQ